MARPLPTSPLPRPGGWILEWKTLDAKTKQPFAFSMRSGEPFACAGLWNAWKETNVDWLQTFAIITTDPNGLTAKVHNRMPVILKRKKQHPALSRCTSIASPVPCRGQRHVRRVHSPRRA